MYRLSDSAAQCACDFRGYTSSKAKHLSSLSRIELGDWRRTGIIPDCIASPAAGRLVVLVCMGLGALFSCQAFGRSGRGTGLLRQFWTNTLVYIAVRAPALPAVSSRLQGGLIVIEVTCSVSHSRDYSAASGKALPVASAGPALMRRPLGRGLRTIVKALPPPPGGRTAAVARTLL
jgi:hypothetical protein